MSSLFVDLTVIDDMSPADFTIAIKSICIIFKKLVKDRLKRFYLEKKNSPTNVPGLILIKSDNGVRFKVKRGIFSVS